MKKLFTFASILLAGLFILSCGGNKENGGGGSATPQLGVAVNNAQAVYEVPKGETASLELVVTADPTSPEAYTITLAANPSLVTAYNVKNGTTYAALPADAFSFPSNQVILVRYTAKSSVATLRIGGGSCEMGVTYLLPVVIDGVQGGTNFEAPDDKAAYILFKTVAPSMQGSGTAADPYIVASAEDLAKVDNVLEEGKTKYFKQTADIDFTGVITEANPWVPINPSLAKEGDEVDPAQSRMLVYDGNNKKISNFTAGGPIFAMLVGSVKDLTIENARIDCAKKNLGGVLAACVGTKDTGSNVVLKNVHVKNSSINNDYQRTGGLIAWLQGGIVENCDAVCTVTSTNPQAGGLIGRVDLGAVKNCWAKGNVSAGYYSGGLIGFAGDVTVQNCHATGNVSHSSGGNYSRVGGLIGQIEGNSTIEKSYATGNMEGTGHMGGGFIGVIGKDGITVNIDQCFSTGNVTMPTESGNWAHVGGFVGTLNSEGGKLNISNCYSTGAIATRRYSGGFVGTIFSKPATLNITNSYTTSDISGVAVRDGWKADGTACSAADIEAGLATYFRHRAGLLIGTVDKWGEGSTVICTGFVAWKSGFWHDPEATVTQDSDWEFSYISYYNPEYAVDVAGNYYGNEGTVSQQATALGWDTGIWDLSGNLPTLKNLIYE
ncbi:MAG: DUF1735 domain-containing protein [Bacteroidales bacterium]|nr:DUF1735 domain-containing protein [Bacteroidales bacterium]